MHKLSTQNLCNLPIDKNAGRVGRARAARKTEKTPTLRSRSLIRKEVNISEMLVRVVGSRTPRLTRQCVLPPDCTLTLLGLFTTGSASLSYLTEALVHIYIPQPRGDLAVRCLCREGLTRSRGRSLSFGLPSLISVYLLQHTLLSLSRGFLKFFQKFFKCCNCDWSVTVHPRIDNTMVIGSHRPWITRPCPLDILIIAHPIPKVKGFRKIKL